MKQRSYKWKNFISGKITLKEEQCFEIWCCDEYILIRYMLSAKKISCSAENWIQTMRSAFCLINSKYALSVSCFKKHVCQQICKVTETEMYAENMKLISYIIEHLNSSILSMNYSALQRSESCHLISFLCQYRNSITERSCSAIFSYK